MNNRDLELLSAYLDGQLTPNESARLETRIKSDPQMESALADLRAARGILRKLPKRKSPRNFTLTRQMVGLNPPLPRYYSFFRFATAFASLLLVLTFAANTVAPRLSYVGPINTGWGGGYGGGIGGGPPAVQQSAPQEMMAATEAAAEEAPMMAEVATEAPAAGAPAMDMAHTPTPTAPVGEDTARVVPTAEAPLGKSAETESPAQPNQPPEEKPALVSIGWQITFLVVALAGGIIMFALRQSAKRKWQ
jgi:hypothetical protein